MKDASRKKINSLFKKSRKFIRAGKVDQSIAVLDEIQKISLERINRDNPKHEDKPVSKTRFIEIISDYYRSDLVRVTYAPKNGRITIKYNREGFSGDQISKFHEIVNFMKDKISYDITYTLRGEIKINRFGEYKLKLKTNRTTYNNSYVMISANEHGVALNEILDNS